MSEATCKIDECDRPTKGHGWCTMHYGRWRRANAPTCSVEGCTAPSVGRGLCTMHYQRLRKDGVVGEATSRRLFTGAERRCTRCGETKKVTEFYLRPTHSKTNPLPQPMSRCKTCMSSLSQDWQKRHPERMAAVNAAYARRARHQKRLNQYGLTHEQFVALEQAQQGACLICQERPDQLVIDHDHATGEVRGLLCQLCNAGLGAFRDTPSYLRRAIIYLARPRAEAAG